MLFSKDNSIGINHNNNGDPSMTHLSMKSASHIAKYTALCIAIPALLFLLAPPLSAQQERNPDHVVVIVPPDAPPTYFRDEKTGRATGFAVDIMDVVAERAGLQVSYIFGNGWTDIIEKVERGEADLAPIMGISEERKKRLAFTMEVDSFPIVFFVHAHKADKTWTPENKTVGVLSGSVAYEKLRNRPTIHFRMYDNFEAGMHELLSGKISAFASPSPIFLQIARDAGLEDHFVMIDPPIDTIHRAIAVRKNNIRLLNRINTALKDFISGEEYQYIHKKWYGEPPPFWTQSRIIGTSVTAILLTILVMAAWRYRSILLLNKKLESTISERDKVNASLRDSEERFRTLFEGANDAVLVHELGRDHSPGLFIQVNEIACRRYGYTREEFSKMTPRDINDPSAMAAHLSRTLEKLRTDGHTVFETVHVAKDGTRIPVEVSAHVVTLAGRPSLISLARDMRERKRAKEALAKWGQIFEHARWGITVGSADGKTIELMNPEFAQMHGYSVEELMHVSIAELFAPECRKDVPEQIRIAHEKGHYLWESRHIRKDGTTFPVLIDVTTVRDSRSEVLYRVVNIQDITERKKAEDAIRQAKEEWERTFDAISDPVMILDTHYRIVKANKAMAEALGTTPAEAAGLTCYESVHGTKQPPDSCPHARLLVNGLANTQEVYEQRLGGYFHVSVSPLYNPDGSLSGSIHTARDITDIKRAEEVLQRSEKKLRDIAACQGEGLYVVDHEGLVTFMNPEAERLLGWTEAELRGRNIHDLVHSRRPDGSYLSFDECPLRPVITGGERIESHDEVFITKDGRCFPVSLISAPLRENGRIAGSVTAFRDISERKQLEQEREKLITELQQAIAEIKTLHGILPICSFCKKIRDDKGAWQQMESYISSHTDALFSHGLCQECAKKMYPEYYKEEGPSSG